MTHLGVVSFLLVQFALGNNVFGATNNERIVGGADAPDGRYPYEASLRSYNIHFCGASILNANWLLTAAHCLKYRDFSYVTVVVGSNKLDEGGDIYEVTKALFHEDYKEFLLKNDIGMIKVPTIVFNERVQPISLYGRYILQDVELTIIGWGTLTQFGAKPNDLQHIDVSTIPIEQCQNSELEFPVFDNQVCTLKQIGQGACHGDSGGSVVLKDQNGEDLLVGLVSFGRECAAGYPDVHIRVYSFIEWINKHCDNCTTIV